MWHIFVSKMKLNYDQFQLDVYFFRFHKREIIASTMRRYTQEAGTVTENQREAIRTGFTQELS